MTDKQGDNAAQPPTGARANVTLADQLAAATRRMGPVEIIAGTIMPGSVRRLDVREVKWITDYQLSEQLRVQLSNIKMEAGDNRQLYIFRNEIVHAVEKPRAPRNDGVEYRKPAAKIARPPGTFVTTVISVVFGKKAYRQYVMPRISDMHVEYFEALSAGRPRLANWFVLRCYLSILIRSGTLLLAAIAPLLKLRGK